MIKSEQKRNKKKVDYYTLDKESIVRVSNISIREF